MLITPEHQALQDKYQQLLFRSMQFDDKRLQKLELIEYQYQQLTKLVYSCSSEKSSAIMPSQLELGINADVVEACNINEGQKIESYTKIKSEKKKHPGRNEIPAHIERKYIDIHPENLPQDAEYFDTIETEQLEYDSARLFATVYRRF